MNESNYEFEIAELNASPLASVYRELYGENEAEQMTHEIWKTLTQKYGMPILAAIGLTVTDPQTHQPRPKDPTAQIYRMREAVRKKDDDRPVAAGGPNPKEMESILDRIFGEI